MELHIGYLELGDQSDGANPRQGDQLGDCCVYMVSDDRGPDGGLGREAVAIGSSAQPHKNNEVVKIAQDLRECLSSWS